MILNLRAVGLKLTPAIHSYVEKKFQLLDKYAAKIKLIDVDLGLATHHHQKGEIYICSAKVELLREEQVITVEKREEDLYKAIDKVKDHLREVLIEKKERKRDGWRQGSKL